MKLENLRRSGRRLRTLILREIRTTLRTPFTLFVMIAVPLGSLMAFGFIVSTELQGTRLGVFDGASSPLSRRIVSSLTSNGTFTPVILRSRDEVEAALIAGEVGAAVIIPADFERARMRAMGGAAAAEIQVFYDGAEPIVAGNAEAAMRGMVQATAAEIAPDVMVTAVARTGGIRAVVRPAFNATLDGRPYMVAGTFGFVLTFLTTLITAVSIVNERLTGTFEQLQLTPATPLEILLGKMIPLGVVFSFDLILMMLVAGYALGTWPVGNPVFFWVIASFYVATSLALGLIFSATSATAAEAVQKTVLSSIPLIQLSGFIYPVRSMPDVVGWAAQLIPATHFIEVSRAIYLRGEGFFDLWTELAIIFVMGVGLMLMALRTLESRL